MFKSMLLGLSSSQRAKWVDPFLWILAFFILIASFVANYQWPAFPLYLKLVGGLVSVLFIVALVSLTKKGLAFWRFSKEARAELRKVHWPARQETLQTTLIVVVMVVVVGLVLWGIDGLFIWVINELTGQRG